MERGPWGSPSAGLRSRSATVHRSRTIAARRAGVWAVIDDPHQLPRWWPGVVRVEAVADDCWTQVYMTGRGRPVRFDYRRVLAEPPLRTLWEQQVEGTPLARVLAESLMEVMLEDEGGGTRVTIAQRQKLKGYSRTGGLLIRRGAAGQLEEALEGLDRLLATGG